MVPLFSFLRGRPADRPLRRRRRDLARLGRLRGRAWPGGPWPCSCPPTIPRAMLGGMLLTGIGVWVLTLPTLMATAACGAAAAVLRHRVRGDHHDPADRTGGLASPCSSPCWAARGEPGRAPTSAPSAAAGGSSPASRSPASSRRSGLPAARVRTARVRAVRGASSGSPSSGSPSSGSPSRGRAVRGRAGQARPRRRGLRLAISDPSRVDLLRGLVVEPQAALGEVAEEDRAADRDLSPRPVPLPRRRSGWANGSQSLKSPTTETAPASLAGSTNVTRTRSSWPGLVILIKELSPLTLSPWGLAVASAGRPHAAAWMYRPCIGRATWP